MDAPDPIIGTLTAELRELHESGELDHVDERKRLLMALIHHALRAMKERQVRSVERDLVKGLVGFAGTFAASAVLVIMAATGLHALGASVGHWVDWLIYSFLLFVVLIILTSRRTFRPGHVELLREGTQIKALKIGQLHHVFERSTAYLWAGYAGMVLGLQVGLLWAGADHLGLFHQRELWDCFLTSVDNACRGLFLDTFEMYELSLGAPVEHGWLSASLFFLFRLAICATIIFFFYELGRRIWWRGLLSEYPEDGAVHVYELNQWLIGAANDSSSWHRQYFDEFYFFLLASLYFQKGVTSVPRTGNRLRPWDL